MLIHSVHRQDPWDFVIKIISENVLHRDQKALFHSLTDLTRNIRNDDDSKFRTLHLNNEQFDADIIRFEGSLLFLHCLGFKLDVDRKDRFSRRLSHSVSRGVSFAAEECLSHSERLSLIQYASESKTSTSSTWRCLICSADNNSLHDGPSPKQQQSRPRTVRTQCWRCGSRRGGALWRCSVCSAQSRCSLLRCTSCSEIWSEPDNEAADPRNSGIQMTAIDLRMAAADILRFNESAGSSVFGTLHSVIKRVLSDDVKYRTLSLSNSMVNDKLLCFEGVRGFLEILGFEQQSDALICTVIPNRILVDSALTVIEEYRDKMDSLNSLCGGLTVPELVVMATNKEMDSDFALSTLLSTHRLFTDSLSLMRSFWTRYFTKTLFENQHCDLGLKYTVKSGALNLMQHRVVRGLRMWIHQFWNDDFAPNPTLQKLSASMMLPVGCHVA